MASEFLYPYAFVIAASLIKSKHFLNFRRLISSLSQLLLSSALKGCYSDFCHHRLISPILEFHMNVIRKNVYFVPGFSYLILSLRFIHVIICIKNLLHFIAEWYFIRWMHHNLFSLSSLDRYVSCFQILCLRNRVPCISFGDAGI